LRKLLAPCLAAQTLAKSINPAASENSAVNYGSSLSVSVIGDWGGNGSKKTTSRGIQVGQSADRSANPNNYDTDFIFLIGDNFYEYGITSAESSRWDSTYKAIFPESYEYIGDMTYYAQTGNHDYRGNVSAEIVYTDMQKRWTMPDLWYSIPNLSNFDNFTVAFITIDTDILKGSYSTDQSKNDVAQKQQDQYAWIRQQLTAAQDYDYIIVAGHHPVFSISSHGTQDFMLTTLYPMLQEFDVSLYLCGHDHNLQQIYSNYYSNRTQSTQTMQFAVSGIGGKYDCSTKNSNLMTGVVNEFFWCGNGSDGGYVQLVADKNSLKVYHLNSKNEAILFTQTIPKRGPSKEQSVGLNFRQQEEGDLKKISILD